MSAAERFHAWPSRPILVTVLLAIALRGAVMLMGMGQFEDPDNYLPLAESLAKANGLSWNGRPTAYRPPLYPMVLAPFLKFMGERRFLGIALLHLGLGAATVSLTAEAARRWGLNARRVLAAAVVVACDPVLIWQSRFVMTETLGAFLLALALAELTRPGWRGAVAGGTCLGLAGLCRPSLLPGAALIILGGLVAKPGSRGDRTLRSLALGVSVTAILAPWAIRNAIVLGEPIWTTTHGGYTLALGNNEAYYRGVLNGSPGRVWTGYDQWLWWDSVNRATTGMSEPQADRFLRDAVVRLALDQPITLLRACLERQRRFWSVAPAMAVYSRSARWATALWTIPLWIALGFGLFRRTLWHWPQIAAPLLVAGLTLVHTLYWTDLRMRAPIVPAIALIAAAAVLPAWLSDRRIFRMGHSGTISNISQETRT
jgi:4-amino-4-deoxy-L-arabinose transferase-like glycosyltransferase